MNESMTQRVLLHRLNNNLHYMKMKNMSRCGFPFTDIPVQETIHYIIHQIYTQNLVPQICRKIIFRRLLLKVTRECSFLLKQKLYKQTEGCSMGGPLSGTLADIHKIRTKNHVVKPLKPLTNKRYVDDIYSRLKKNCTDQLYHELNN